MIAHKEEIFSRPKRTWFVTEREKMLAAKAAKVFYILSWLFMLYALYVENKTVPDVHKLEFEFIFLAIEICQYHSHSEEDTNLYLLSYGKAG